MQVDRRAPVSVLHFTDANDTSGFFPQLARRHDRRRYRMLFGTLRPMAPWLRELMAGEEVTCLSCEARARRAYPLAALRLARFLRRERVQILHAHLFEPSAVGMMAGMLAATPARVMTRHYSDYHTRIHKRVHVLVDRMCIAMANRVIAVSQHTADHLVHMEGAPQGKIDVVPNGIDFSRVAISTPDAAERVRRELAPDGEHLLLVPARLHPEKGQSHFFRALPRIREGLTRPVVALVAGAGSFEGVYREEVRRLGCHDCVRFLGFRRDIVDVMAAADLVVLPSVAEAFGLVLVEALYLGTPVVATRVGGIPEIVEDGVDGVLVRPADSSALADAILSLLNDEARRRRMAGAGRERAAALFGFERMVRSYEAVYERLAMDSGG